MKVKHLLFSSLVLSVGFAACTSDVEEFSAQAPVTNPEGIELGEGFSFQVENAGFGADAETRAAFEKVGTKWIPGWENTDKVGAAMYSMVTGLYPSGHKLAGEPNSFFDFLNVNHFYGSNNEFAYQGEDENGATFTSATNSMVGAYVLYYPYDKSLNDKKAFDKILVYSGAKAENATNLLKFDATNVEDGVNKRIFAATIAKFGTNTNNAPKFKLQQVPNLYMVKFALKEKLLMTLANPIKIQNIIMEAYTDDACTKSAVNKNGYVEPKMSDLNNNNLHFIHNGETIEENEYSLGGILFKADDSKFDAPNLNIEPSNVADDSDLNIKQLGDKDANGNNIRTAPYYFSALPLDKGVKKIKFTIIANVDGVDKVFTKVYDENEEVMYKFSNVPVDPNANPIVYKKNWAILTERAEGMGQVINLGVVLDTEEEESKQIYTLSQFKDKWTNGQQEFNFAIAGLKFDDANFGITEFTSENGNIVFDGAEQKLAQNITTTKGTFTFKNNITIDGNVTADKYAISFVEDATIIGDVTADGATITFGKGATIKGNVTTKNGGKVIFNGATTVTKSAEDATDGIINVAQGTVVEFSDQSTATVGMISNAGNVTFAGKTKTGDITSTGGSIALTYEATGTNDIPSIGNIDATATTVTLKKANIASVKAVNSTITTVAGTVIKGNVNVEGKALTLNATVKGNLEANGVVLKGAPAITGDANLKNTVAEFGTVAVGGEMTVDVESQIKKGTITTAGTLSVYGDVEAGVIVNSITTLNVKTTGVVNVTGKKATDKIETVNIEKGVSKSGELTANDIVLGNITNNGKIEGEFSVDGTFDQYGKADAAVITLNKQTDKAGVVLNRATLNVYTDMNTAGITNDGTINVKDKVKLTGKIINNYVIDIATGAEVTETNMDELTMAEDAVINVASTASLKYNTSTAKPGIVYVANGFSDVPTKGSEQQVVAYTWIGTTAPKQATADACNRICIDGATVVDSQWSLLADKAVCLYDGGMNITPAKGSTVTELTITGVLIVKESAKIATTSKILTKLTISGTSNYVAEGQIFTLDEKLSLYGGTLRLTKDAKFEGNVGDATVQHVASL